MVGPFTRFTKPRPWTAWVARIALLVITLFWLWFSLVDGIGDSQTLGPLVIVVQLVVPLLLICLLMLSHNLTSTFLYNGLAVLVDQNIIGFDERTQFFSYVDLIVQILAFLFQFLITSRLVIYLGMPRTAILPPILLAAGFTLLGSSLGLVLFAAVQVAQRALNYGLLGPVKEMLFTVVDRETKYKSKNFIDTVVYRGSDVTASWLFKGMMTAGLSISQIAWLYIPLMGMWAVLAWNLGKAYTRLKIQMDSTTG